MYDISPKRQVALTKGVGHHDAPLVCSTPLLSLQVVEDVMSAGRGVGDRLLVAVDETRASERGCVVGRVGRVVWDGSGVAVVAGSLLG